MSELSQRMRGCLLGLAAGDAVGTSVEFARRGSFTPLTDMIGGGPFHLKPGQWTDDTSMALCLASSLVERRGFDARDQMERYWDWYRNGTFSSTGRCFDIGATTQQALQRYKETGEPFSGSTDPYSAGNGSIMRLAPVAMAYYPDRDVDLALCGGELAYHARRPRVPGRLPPAGRHPVPGAERGKQGGCPAEHQSATVGIQEDPEHRPRGVPRQAGR